MRSTKAVIAFDGADISEDIEPYLLSVTYTDNEEDEADDLQLKFQDKEGIWLTDWLEVAMNAVATDPVITSQGASQGTGYTVNAQSGLVLREKPSKESKRLGAYAYGTQVSATDTSGSWYAVTVGGQSGYMWGSYLTPAGGGGSSDYPTLRFGAQGENVKKMQSALVSKGQTLPKYGIDGYFGSETQGALKAFQTSAGLSADGVCGPVTWEALLGGGTSTAQKRGLVITASLCREDWDDDHGDELDCGQFELDTVQGSGPPSVITLKAASLPFTQTVRQTKKDKAWENYSLSSIAREIASGSGMTCMFESGTDVTYKRIEQKETADIAFLSKLCHDSGLSLKVTNNIIVIFDQQQYESGDSIMTIAKDDGSYSKYSFSAGQADVQYASCRVSYTAPDGTVIEGLAKIEDYDADSKTNQQLEITAKVNDIGEAQRLAVKHLRLHNKFQKTMTFTLPGNPDMTSGVCVEVENFGPWSGKYIVKQAKHSLAKSSGYTTQVTLRRVLGGY